MPRHWSLRLAAAVLIIAFLGGGIGMPVFDAAAYHHSQSTDTRQAHVEATGGEACHGERCVLPLATSAPRVTIQSVATIVAEPPVLDRPGPCSAWIPAAAHPRWFGYSRAPPAVLS